MMKTTNKMSNKKYIVILIFAFFFLNIMGYALISSSVKWQSEKYDSDAVWDVSFKNVIVDAGSVEAIVPATISDTGSEVNYIVDLINSSDYYAFEVDVVNNGNIDAKVDSIFKASLSNEQLNLMNYDITYLDGTFVSQNDVLKAGESQTLVVSVKYKDDVNLVELSTDIAAIELSFSINYVQAN